MKKYASEISRVSGIFKLLLPDSARPTPVDDVSALGLSRSSKYTSNRIITCEQGHILVNNLPDSLGTKQDKEDKETRAKRKRKGRGQAGSVKRQKTESLGKISYHVP